MEGRELAFQAFLPSNVKIKPVSFHRTMTDHEIITLAKIREALGIGHEPMLSDLPKICRQIRLDAERYRKLRSIPPSKLMKLPYKRSLDEFTDSLK